MLNQDTLHQDARAVALQAASAIVAETDSDLYAWAGDTAQMTDTRRTQATVTMAQEFYRFIVHGDTQV